MDLISEIIKQAFSNEIDYIDLKFFYPAKFNLRYEKSQTGYTLYSTDTTLRLFKSPSTVYVRKLEGKFLMIVKNVDGFWNMIESTTDFTAITNIRDTTSIIQYLGTKTRFFGSSQYPDDSLRVSYLGL
jgi:hypothetical protein